MKLEVTGDNMKAYGIPARALFMLVQLDQRPKKITGTGIVLNTSLTLFVYATAEMDTTLIQDVTIKDQPLILNNAWEPSKPNEVTRKSAFQHLKKEFEKLGLKAKILEE